MPGDLKPHIGSINDETGTLSLSCLVEYNSQSYLFSAGHVLSIEGISLS